MQSVEHIPASDDSGFRIKRERGFCREDEVLHYDDLNHNGISDATEGHWIDVGSVSEDNNDGW